MYGLYSRAAYDGARTVYENKLSTSTYVTKKWLSKYVDRRKKEKKGTQLGPNHKIVKLPHIIAFNRICIRSK